MDLFTLNFIPLLARGLQISKAVLKRDLSVSEATIDSWSLLIHVLSPPSMELVMKDVADDESEEAKLQPPVPTRRETLHYIFFWNLTISIIVKGGSCESL